MVVRSGIFIRQIILSVFIHNVLKKKSVKRSTQNNVVSENLVDIHCLLIDFF